MLGCFDEVLEVDDALVDALGADSKTTKHWSVPSYQVAAGLTWGGQTRRGRDRVQNEAMGLLGSGLRACFGSFRW